MKRILLVLLSAALGILSAGAYTDERGHNLDSLERAVAPWTPDAIDKASEQELQVLNRAYRDLMLGYNILNGEKSDYYARKALSISRRKGWAEASLDACRYIGMHFYANEQYDSALVYYGKALEMVSLMDEADTKSLDDAYSALYGTLGNLYNVMGDLPKAMEYYEKAGEIFERNGWNESNSILYYNIGETWVDGGDLRRAAKAYDKAMTYAQASGDSLMIVNVWKGYGRLYMEKGRTGKSLRYLRKADAFYAAHPDMSPGFRTENLDYMKAVLSRQQHRLGMLTGILVGLLLLAAGMVFARRRRKGAAPEGCVSAPSASSSAADEMARNPGPLAAPSSDSPQLSDREKEILSLLAKGYTAPQIAEALSLSPETIRWYRKKLLVKFDVANTPELIFQAREKGVL